MSDDWDGGWYTSNRPQLARYRKPSTREYEGSLIRAATAEDVRALLRRSSSREWMDWSAEDEWAEYWEDKPRRIVREREAREAERHAAYVEYQREMAKRKREWLAEREAEPVDDERRELTQPRPKRRRPSDRKRGLLLPGDVADMLSVSIGTLANWRVQGKGPPFVRVGALIRYRREDVIAWVDGSARAELPRCRDCGALIAPSGRAGRPRVRCVSCSTPTPERLAQTRARRSARGWAPKWEVGVPPPKLPPVPTWRDVMVVVDYLNEKDPGP